MLPSSVEFFEIFLNFQKNFGSIEEFPQLDRLRVCTPLSGFTNGLRSDDQNQSPFNSTISTPCVINTTVGQLKLFYI
ncbi:hypothetical protein DERP_012623 [Dermatophagoides pteronyssinus]|uniref:Uncharacterized protein n=1 Tax=Dermatophagoides pteronyssinus TaxID=6956 RepID=A0ABQ8IYD7_DERPT|nr:hypothetical protein DERP_012623 [Dermatophagoides pteronyssinus]